MAAADAPGRRRKEWWPPGFRFHPTDEELVLFYLKRKICGRRFRLPMIADIDVYKLDPWDLPDKSLLRSGDKQWYFFSPRDKKYPNGSRSNRATNNGYWKATGKDRAISHYSKVVGNKKTLVYYQGRAPKGYRTDWVMHEYTVDEGVLLSYNNVQDYYALYKVFRKSGPGPKNGEQYGAPFREEEWHDDDDDDDADDRFRVKNNGDVPIIEQPKVDSVPSIFGDNQNMLIIEQPKVDPVPSMLGDNQNMLPIDDLEDLLLQISNEDVVQQHSEASVFLSEVDFEAEVGSCMLPHLETTTENNDAWRELHNMDMSFDIALLDSSDSQAFEMSQVTSFTNFTDQSEPIASEEFLEIEDLYNPDTGVLSTVDIGDGNQAQDTNGLDDLDEFFDASVFVGEAVEPVDRATSSLYFSGFNNDEGQNQMFHITTDLWMHEQALNFSTVEPNQIAMASPSSGVFYADTLADVGEPSLAQGTHIRSASDSWFSSALSALLESVPTHPALASENALINRALVRMSSFGAGRRGVHNQDNTAGGASTVGRRRGGNDGASYLFLSLLVGLVAVIWVLSIGTAVKVIKGLWSKFISS